MSGKLSYPAHSCERVSKVSRVEGRPHGSKEDRIYAARPDGNGVYFEEGCTKGMGNRVVIAQFEDTKPFEQFECRRQSQTHASLSVGHGASNYN